MIVKVSLVEHDFVGQKGYSLLKIQTNICIFDEKMEKKFGSVAREAL